MISPEVKRYYKTCKGWHPDTVMHRMADAYVDAEARARKAEFLRWHHAEQRHCLITGHGGARCSDDRHYWTHVEWQAEVVRELEG